MRRVRVCVSRVLAAARAHAPVCAVTCLCWLAIGAARADAGDEPRATTDRGEILRGRIAGQTPHDLRWVAADGRSLPLAALRRIDFPPAASLAPADGPLRQITLRGGDRVTGVLVALDGRQAKLALRGVGRVTLPRAEVTEIGTLPGLRDLIYEDFENDALKFTVASGEPEGARRGEAGGTRALVLDRPVRLGYTPDAPLDAGRVQLRFRTARGAVPQRERGVELEFAAAADPDVLRIVLSDGDGQPAVAAPRAHDLSVQALPARDGWRQLTVLLQEHRLNVLVDEHVLASGPAPSGGLIGLRLFCDRARSARTGATGGLPASRDMASNPFARADKPPVAPKSTSRGAVAESAPLLIDDVLIQEFVPARRRSAQRLGRDVVELDSGDRLFGSVTAADSHSVELSGAFGAVHRRWPDVSWILLDAPAPEATPASVSGLWARVILHSPIDQPPTPEDAFDLALQSVADGDITGQHELLGEIRLALAEVRCIEPRFIGRRITLTRDAHHLGDETRTEFPRPVPEGHTLSGEWSLEALPPGRAFFAVDVADLEPSGPDAPLGTPFLRELQDGFLRTDVWVNGQRLGSLNELLRWKPRLDDPRRVRLAIPDGVLKAGRNVWKIEQRAARRNPREFDDASLGPIAVEFDEGS